MSAFPSAPIAIRQYPPRNNEKEPTAGRLFFVQSGNLPVGLKPSISPSHIA